MSILSIFGTWKDVASTPGWADIYAFGRQRRDRGRFVIQENTLTKDRRAFFIDLGGAKTKLDIVAVESLINSRVAP